MRQSEDDEELGDIIGITFIVDYNNQKFTSSFFGPQQTIIELRSFLR